MSDAPIDIEKKETRTRIANRCAADTGVTLRTAYGVLWQNWPITNVRREMALRWAISKRILAPRDVVVKPPRKRRKPDAPAAPMRKVVKALDELVRGGTLEGFRSQMDAELAAERAVRERAIAADVALVEAVLGPKESDGG